jgi:hypothetical protein
MKTQYKLVAGAIVATAVVGAFALMPTALAYKGDATKTGPNHTEAREAAIEQIMAKKDFAAWQKLMTTDGRQPGVLRKIDTQAEFEKFAEAWRLSKTGNSADATKAAALRTELTLGQQNGSGNRGGAKGQNNGGNFVDANKDGKCDNL